MPSPFSGMDPYLEDPIEWPDVHFRLIGALSRQLTPQIAPIFYARVERRVSIVGPDSPEPDVIIPDIYLAQTGAPPSQPATSAATIAAPPLLPADAAWAAAQVARWRSEHT